MEYAEPSVFQRFYLTLFSSWGTVTIHKCIHPRRPRGQSFGSGEKAARKFSLRAKEPLGTDSHRTISKNSSGCRLLIGHKKCFVLLCPIGEQISMSSFRVFVHDGYCLDHGLSSLCTKEMHVVRKLSVWYKIPIWSNSLTLSNASELFWTISKFMKRMNLLLLVYSFAKPEVRHFHG